MAFLKRLLKKKDALSELKAVTTNLEFLADAETLISEFYRLCADAMEQDGALWNSLAEAELQHSENARQLIRLINRQPKLYKPGISFSTASIRMFTIQMQNLLEKMRAGKLPSDKLFSIAVEIEDSAVELNYGKIVKTKDKMFNALARQIDSESAEHKSTLSSRISSRPAR